MSSGISVTFIEDYGQATNRRGLGGNGGGNGPPGAGNGGTTGGNVVGGGMVQAPPRPVLPGERHVLRDVEAGAGSCGVLKCWLWLPIGAGVGIGLGLVTLAIVGAVRRRRGG